MTDFSDDSLDSLSKADFPPPPAAYRLRLVEVRSFLVVSQRLTRVRNGSLEECAAFARQALVRNLLLGWWGFPFGIVWTLMALFSNHKALKDLRGLESSGPAAAWFQDPSGRHGARYWDGSAWTNRVSDVSTDELPEMASPGLHP